MYSRHHLHLKNVMENADNQQNIFDLQFCLNFVESIIAFLLAQTFFAGDFIAQGGLFIGQSSHLKALLETYSSFAIIHFVTALHH